LIKLDAVDTLALKTLSSRECNRAIVIISDTQARAAALERPLDEMKAAILPNLGKWTEWRNEQLAVMAAT
jgi:hypothetical protein